MTDQPGPLDGVTVLDLTENIAGPYCTKLFADFGADVIKVEPLSGDPSRSVGPYYEGLPGLERSGTFFYFNTNKRSLVLDLEHADAGVVVERLIQRADIVVESQPPGRLDELGLGWEWISSLRDDLPLVSISPFGHDSPYRDYKVSDLVLYGFAGEMYSIGVQDREPVKMFGTASLVECGAASATAALAALTAAELQGIGPAGRLLDGRRAVQRRRPSARGDDRLGVRGPQVAASAWSGSRHVDRRLSLRRRLRRVLGRRNPHPQAERDARSSRVATRSEVVAARHRSEPGSWWTSSTPTSCHGR